MLHLATTASPPVAHLGRCAHHVTTRFDINTFTCKLDAASHPCAAIKEASSCQASTAGCKVQHVCRDSCSSCPSCLDAMKAFARMPPVLAQLESESSSSSRRDRDEFFDEEEQEEEAVVAVQKLEDHQTTGFLKVCGWVGAGVDDTVVYK